MAQAGNKVPRRSAIPQKQFIIKITKCLEYISLQNAQSLKEIPCKNILTKEPLND